MSSRHPRVEPSILTRLVDWSWDHPSMKRNHICIQSIPNYHQGMLNGVCTGHPQNVQFPWKLAWLHLRSYLRLIGSMVMISHGSQLDVFFLRSSSLIFSSLYRPVATLLWVAKVSSKVNVGIHRHHPRKISSGHSQFGDNQLNSNSQHVNGAKVLI
jgi:hypothetical protein